jgi:hypothetical protein
MPPAHYHYTKIIKVGSKEAICTENAFGRVRELGWDIVAFDEPAFKGGRYEDEDRVQPVCTNQSGSTAVRTGLLRPCDAGESRWDGG